MNLLRIVYLGLILKRPRLILGLVVLALVYLGYQITRLEVDASAETLVLEDDKDLRLSRIVNGRYETPDFLVITFSPVGDLLAEKTLETLGRLKADLLKLERVESVDSILDVPLMESPPKPLKELLKDVPTLQTHQVDLALAKKEFLQSPIYKNNLVSADFKTTALLVNLKGDEVFKKFVDRRYDLREKEKDGTITAEELAELDIVLAEFKRHRDRMRQIEHDNILAVRAVMDKYRTEASLFLGGVSMIADDLVTFVKSDLRIFGLGVLVFLLVTLGVIFRQKRWILLPLLTCSLSVAATSGLLVLFGWEVTVISSNFISLQIIITMALTIHLIVRYREFSAEDPQGAQQTLVLKTVMAMAPPCFFMVLTTIAGFSSLLLSGMLPVINFGWMMSAGIAVSLILTFLIFPTVLMQMGTIAPNYAFESKFGLTNILANFTERRGKTILVGSALLLVFCLVGASQLRVENSFIDYFKESTEIFQGMQSIDQKLGGTTPLDVVLDFPSDDEENIPTVPASSGTAMAASSNNAADSEEEIEEFDAFEEEFEEEKGQAQYWFTSDKMAEVEKVHDYLDGLSETGKVMSLGTMLKVGRTLNDGDPLDNFALALVYNELPEKFRKIILDPYVSVENNQVRFAIRIKDSEPTLRRNNLLHKIQDDLHEKLGLAEDRYKLTGIMVLYNNMLQSLFNSQILTLGAVVVALMAMFLILFRSLKIAIIAIFPNILSVGVVLGVMGWVGIPLDMMTITIAAISVGIAVDDTIHYIHRFIEEFKTDGNYVATMHRCHASIGYAMYYTSVTIIVGFSILVFSNFIPSIYFGLLTGLAMVIALLAALTLLPQMMIMMKPLGPGKV